MARSDRTLRQLSIQLSTCPLPGSFCSIPFWKMMRSGYFAITEMAKLRCPRAILYLLYVLSIGLIVGGDAVYNGIGRTKHYKVLPDPSLALAGFQSCFASDQIRKRRVLLSCPHPFRPFPFHACSASSWVSGFGPLAWQFGQTPASPPRALRRVLRARYRRGAYSPRLMSEPEPSPPTLWITDRSIEI